MVQLPRFTSDRGEVFFSQIRAVASPFFPLLAPRLLTCAQKYTSAEIMTRFKNKQFFNPSKKPNVCFMLFTASLIESLLPNQLTPAQVRTLVLSAVRTLLSVGAVQVGCDFEGPAYGGIVVGKSQQGIVGERRGWFCCSFFFSPFLFIFSQLSPWYFWMILR